MPTLEPTPPPLLADPQLSSDGRELTQWVQEHDGNVYKLVYPTLTDDRSVEIGQGIRAPEHIELHAEIDAGDVTLKVIPRSGGFHVRGVTLESSQDDVPVTSESLRTVPVGRLLHACRYAVFATGVPSLANTTWSSHQLGGWVPEYIREQWPSGRVDVVLDTVTLLYRIAAAVGEAPTQSVAASFGVSRATASRMIAKAREAGLLEPADRQWTGGNTRPRK